MSESTLAIILGIMALLAAPGIWSAWAQVKIAKEARKVVEEDKSVSPDLVRSWQTIADNERTAAEDLRLRLKSRSNDYERALTLMASWRTWALKLEAQLRIANIPPARGKPEYKENGDL